jgi:peptidoglycan/xylan/chitin deacetylase (PgdA/CDA1 family)
VVLVAGRAVPAASARDVATAIRVAEVDVPDGRLLAVVSHRVLDAHAVPAEIRVNGQVVSSAAALRPGDVVTFVAAPDRVEGICTVSVPVRLDAGAAALYTGYRPGTSREVVGRVSGEVVRSTLLSAPTVGKLRTPARFALTFDDGPNPPATQQVLTLLAAHHAPAVFCLIGADTLAHPSLARREAAAGYRLCDHTQTHPLNLPSLRAAQIAEQIRAGYNSIMRSDGHVPPRYFRAPGGNWSATIDADARALHLTPLHWTVDPRDWSRPGTEVIVTRVLNQLRPNGIVLMHDGGGDRSETVAALRQLLGELIAAGWTPTLPTWVH